MIPEHYFTNLNKSKIMNTEYKTGQATWTHGEKMQGYNEWHSHLGPCPACGTITFDYGGGWRCMAQHCFNNASNPVGNLGPSPAWWNTGIQVMKDGTAWCAHDKDFINIQESHTGWGDTPQKAVDNFFNPQ